MGAQTGKTEGLLNIQGHRLDDNPAPILYVGPTKSMVEKLIEPRFIKMVAAVPSLWDQLARGKASSKSNKQIAGVTVRFAWAGSATELASQDAAIVEVDELDRMKAKVGAEGSPLELAEARLESYPDGFSIVTSTPTEGRVETETDEHGIERWRVGNSDDIRSPIWRLMQSGTRHEWAWPCPECKKHFVPRFRLLFIPENATPQEAKKAARMTCPHCGAMIENRKKIWMNARGVYLAPGQHIDKDGNVVGEAEENDTASFWVSGLCSPWRSWGDRARAYVEAVQSGDVERIRTVINTRFGELYSLGREAPTVDNVKACTASYRAGEVPDGVRIITAFCDVQKRKLVYAVRGWARGMESWLLDHDEIHGETDGADVWLQLAELQERTYNGRRIMRLGIDSGYRPGEKWRRPDNIIYQFCYQRRGWAIATKGHDKLSKPLSPSQIDVTLSGQKAGLQLWHLDSDFFKCWIHQQLHAQPGARRWHLPIDITEDYCRQITAEARTLTRTGRVVWERLRRENHYLDCEAGNVAVAYSLGVHRQRQKTTAPEVTTPTAPPPAPDFRKPHAPFKMPRPRGGFINRYKW